MWRRRNTDYIDCPPFRFFSLPFLFFLFFILTFWMVKGQARLAWVAPGLSRNWPSSAGLGLSRTRRARRGHYHGVSSSPGWDSAPPLRWHQRRSPHRSKEAQAGHSPRARPDQISCVGRWCGRWSGRQVVGWSRCFRPAPGQNQGTRGAPSPARLCPAGMDAPLVFPPCMHCCKSARFVVARAPGAARVQMGCRGPPQRWSGISDIWACSCARLTDCSFSSVVCGWKKIHFFIKYFPHRVKILFLAHPTCWNKCMTSKNTQCSSRSGFWVFKISRKVRVLPKP